MVAQRDDGAAVLSRLASLVPQDAGADDAGWVPRPPDVPDAAVPGPGGPARGLGEVAEGAAPGLETPDGGAPMRGALAAAMATYTAAHGHPLAHDEAGVPRRVRVAVGGRVALVALVVLALVVAAVAVRAWRRAPSATLPTTGAVVVAPAEDGAADGAAGADGGGAEAAGRVVVHVVGQVAAPGVVELPAGSRVADAVEAAGGATAGADLAAVNLARVLVDGEQVVVPAPGQAAPAAAAGAGGGGGDGLVDLNTADAAELDTLPGIGPVLADRIVAWRAEHGRFTTVDELAEVSGIGPALLSRLRDLVRVG